MKVLLTVLICFIAGCTAFDPVYSDIKGYQQSRDSRRCIDKVTYYLGKGYFTDNQKAELSLLRGICYNQIGYFEESMTNFDYAVEIADDSETKAKALFQRALLSFASAADGRKDFTGRGCSDIAESCRLAPEKYCSEYNIKKQPPTNCR